MTTRRNFLSGAAATVAALSISGCVSNPPGRGAAISPAMTPAPIPAPASGYAAMYAAVPGEPFPVTAVNLSQIDPAFLRREVAYTTDQPPGSIVVDPHARYLYHVQPGGYAMRYGVGVGREGFGWSGMAVVNSKQEWPDWYPPKEMVERQPEIEEMLTDLQGGRGMPGGLRNPLGARALYLWENGRDTLYRIHGTFEPWTIGRNVSSGCVRMINQDAIHLYDRVAIGSPVVVLPGGGLA